MGYAESLDLIDETLAIAQHIIAERHAIMSSEQATVEDIFILLSKTMAKADLAMIETLRNMRLPVDNHISRRRTEDRI